MATEKRLIDAKDWDSFYADMGDSRNMRDSYDTGYTDALDRVDDWIDAQPTVDAVEVSRLGKLGQLMMPYRGCPRGAIGPRGMLGNGAEQVLGILELDAITDVDGNRWIPVLDYDLADLKARAQTAVEVVRCKDCFANGCCSVQIDLDMGDDGYCPKGRKENQWLTPENMAI